MKPLHWLVVFCCVFSAVGALAGADGDDGPKEVKDQIQGKWLGDKGTFAATDSLTFTKYAAFKPGTAGDYSFAQLRGDLVGPGGKKLPPAEVVVGVGSYALDGTMLTLSPGALAGPVGKSKVVWEVVKATGDALVVKTDKGKTEEFKKAP